MFQKYLQGLKGCRSRDRMVVGFTTTNAISAYHHWSCEFESRLGRGVQHYLWQVHGFLQVLRFRPPWYSWNIVESGIKHHQTNICMVVCYILESESDGCHCRVTFNPLQKCGKSCFWETPNLIEVYVRSCKWFLQIINLYVDQRWFNSTGKQF